MLDYTIIDYQTYKTAQGDTFDSIALAFYYDEMKASLIIEANPDYCDVLIFDAHIELKIPIIDGTTTPETLPPWRRNAE